MGRASLSTTLHRPTCPLLLATPIPHRGGSAGAHIALALGGPQVVRKGRACVIPTLSLEWETPWRTRGAAESFNTPLVRGGGHSTPSLTKPQPPYQQTAIKRIVQVELPGAVTCWP